MAKKTKQKKEAPVVEVKEQKKEPKSLISFDVWYFSKKIPKQHTKEIIWADFNARGAEAFETKEKYNEYLALYGIK